MIADKPLIVGDVIECVRANGSRTRYQVIGFTARGKTKVLSDRTGAVSARWWSSRETLPQPFRWVMWMGSQ